MTISKEEKVKQSSAMNLIEILKDVLKGTKLYSPAFGVVTLKKVTEDIIVVDDSCDIERVFFSDGRFYKDSECVLFPSRENRDWSTFRKFDINTLKPFDKVLVRDHDTDLWKCDFYSHYIKNTHYTYRCIYNQHHQCVPYNNETEHLVGTDEDCPEYYKTW